MQKTGVALAFLLAIVGTALSDQINRSFYDLKTTALVGNKLAELGVYRGKVTLASITLMCSFG